MRSSSAWMLAWCATSLETMIQVPYHMECIVIVYTWTTEWATTVPLNAHAYTVHVCAVETHQTRQDNTTTPTDMAHFLFKEKVSCPRWDSNPHHYFSRPVLYMYLYLSLWASCNNPLSTTIKWCHNVQFWLQVKNRHPYVQIHWCTYMYMYNHVPSAPQSKKEENWEERKKNHML